MYGGKFALRVCGGGGGLIFGGAYAWRRVFSEFLRYLTSRPFVLPGELVPNQKIDK